MSLHRFFLEDQILSESADGKVDIALSNDDLKHLRAARISQGELVAVIDASTDYFQCEVVELTDNGFTAKIATKRQVERLPFTLDLFQGVPKAGKMEEVVRHGTEIGISNFYPLKCKRSVAKLDDKKAAAKIERLNRVAKSAAVQAGCNAIPVVHSPINVNEAAYILRSYDACVIFWEEANETLSLADALLAAKVLISDGVKCRIAVIVGPEGGIDETEIELLLSNVENAKLSTLGPNILRTETAGVVGCALVSYELGGMGAVSFAGTQDSQF